MFCPEKAPLSDRESSVCVCVNRCYTRKACWSDQAPQCLSLYVSNQQGARPPVMNLVERSYMAGGEADGDDRVPALIVS